MKIEQLTSEYQQRIASYTRKAMAAHQGYCEQVDRLYRIDRHPEQEIPCHYPSVSVGIDVVTKRKVQAERLRKYYLKERDNRLKCFEQQLSSEQSKIMLRAKALPALLAWAHEKGYTTSGDAESELMEVGAARIEVVLGHNRSDGGWRSSWVAEPALELNLRPSNGKWTSRRYKFERKGGLNLDAIKLSIAEVMQGYEAVVQRERAEKVQASSIGAVIAAMARPGLQHKSDSDGRYGWERGKLHVYPYEALSSERDWMLKVHHGGSEPSKDVWAIEVHARLSTLQLTKLIDALDAIKGEKEGAQ